MKIKNLMMMMVAAVAIVMGMSACGNDDDEPAQAVASQVAGSYTGEEIMTVMGDPDKGTKTFEFTKASDTSIDMTIPEYGEGMMSLPALLVKNITLTKNGDNIVGRLASYEGTVLNSKGEQKVYSVNDVTIIFNNNKVVVTFALKYGNMPFDFVGQFSGNKK
jgi:hypothetical protein